MKADAIGDVADALITVGGGIFCTLVGFGVLAGKASAESVGLTRTAIKALRWMGPLLILIGTILAMHAAGLF